MRRNLFAHAASFGLILALAGCGAGAPVPATLATGLADAQVAIDGAQAVYGIAKGIAEQVATAHPSMQPTIASVEAKIEALLAAATTAAATGGSVATALQQVEAAVCDLETSVGPYFKAVANTTAIASR